VIPRGKDGGGAEAVAALAAGFGSPFLVDAVALAEGGLQERVSALQGPELKIHGLLLESERFRGIALPFEEMSYGCWIEPCGSQSADQLQPCTVRLGVQAVAPIRVPGGR
jgi:hypothetical protein